jgi:pimeloyl-ACP methyl ester carboxylesterase
MDLPETRYTKTEDGYHIAYTVFGGGPVDLVYLGPLYSHLELNWQILPWARFMTTIASFARVIMFDRRGNGLSDPVPLDAPPLLEARIDDVVAVMDAAGSERAIVYGSSESGALAMLFAATHPQRTLGLIVLGGDARTAWAPDYPWGLPLEERDAELALVETEWGTEDFVAKSWPSIADDPALVRAEASMARNAMSPGAAVAYYKMIWEIDVRDALPTIHVPTLILHRAGDQPEVQQFLAQQIPTAELVSLPGNEHVPYLGNQNEVTDQIRRFTLQVHDQESVFDRVLATVLFTDVVGSTQFAADLGDAEWTSLLGRHNQTVRGLIGRFAASRSELPATGFWPLSTVPRGQ